MLLNADSIPEGIRAMVLTERIAGFFIIGVLSSLIDIGLLFFFTACLGIWYLYSAAASYCCGTLVSYVLNKNLTFHDGNRNYFSQFSSFAAISVSCLMITVCIIWLAVEWFAVNYLLAKVLAASCAFFWNYFGQSRITFRTD